MNKIRNGLYIRGHCDNPLWPTGFPEITLLIRLNNDEPQPKPPTSQHRLLNAPFEDTRIGSHGGPTPELLEDLCKNMQEEIEIGGGVLVQCYGGLNRSGLVCAYYLIRVHRYSADRAIQHVVAHRGRSFFGIALNNSHFTAWLKTIEGNR